MTTSFASARATATPRSVGRAAGWTAAAVVVYVTAWVAWVGAVAALTCRRRG